MLSVGAVSTRHEAVGDQGDEPGLTGDDRGDRQLQEAPATSRAEISLTGFGERESRGAQPAEGPRTAARYDRAAVVRIQASEPPAAAAIAAIQAGDLVTLRRLLEDEPELATARIERGRTHTLTLLHVAADWPGHFPHGADAVAALVAAGADVNARYEGPHEQTPLHWAASSDDVDVLDALLQAGADIEAPGAFNGVGGPLDNAVGYGQWNAARRLVERGAHLKLWHAAALGLTDRIEARFAQTPPPSGSEVTEAFWQACHGDQRASAEYLADRGADLNWIGYDDLTPLDVAWRSAADDLAHWLATRGGKSAQDVNR